MVVDLFNAVGRSGASLHYFYGNPMVPKPSFFDTEKHRPFVVSDMERFLTTNLLTMRWAASFRPHSGILLRDGHSLEDSLTPSLCAALAKPLSACSPVHHTLKGAYTSHPCF